MNLSVSQSYLLCVLRDDGTRPNPEIVLRIEDMITGAREGI